MQIDSTGELNTVVERYGLVLRNNDGSLRSNAELLRDIARLMRDARNEQERAAIGMQAFGDVGRRMAQAMAEGPEALDRMISEAREAGHVVDAELIQRAEDLDDRFDDLTRSAGNFFKQLLVNAADTLVRLADMRLAFEDLMRASRGRTGEAIGENLAGAMNEEQLRAAADAVGEYDRAIVQLRGEAQAAIQHLDAFSENLRMAGSGEAADQMEGIADRMTEIIDRFDAGTMTTGEFTEEMDRARGQAITLVDSLQGVDAQGFDHVTRAVLQLHDRIMATIGAAQDLASAAGAAVPEPGLARRAQDTAHRDREVQLQRDREALQEFLVEQERLAGRTREQIALENELRAVQRAAREDNVTITREVAEERARLNLQLRQDATPTGGGGGGAGGSQDDFARAVAAIRERTAALEAEAVALASAAGSGREYGQAITYAYERARLMTAAQRDGLAITPELEAAIDSLADAYARAGEAAGDAAEQMRTAQADAERGGKAITDLFMGLAQGGDHARQALAQLLLQMAQVQMQQAVMGLGGTKTGGNLLTLLGGLIGLSGGGYTGSGPADQVAGVVHGGEYVFSKPAVDRIGLHQLESMHRGYRSGGHVSPARSMPSTPQAGPQKVKVDVGVSVDNEGAVTAYVKRVVQEDTPGIAIPIIRQGLQEYDRELPQRFHQIARDPRRRG